MGCNWNVGGVDYCFILCFVLVFGFCFYFGLCFFMNLLGSICSDIFGVKLMCIVVVWLDKWWWWWWWGGRVINWFYDFGEFMILVLGIVRVVKEVGVGVMLF